MQEAHSTKADAIRDAIRKVTNPKGEKVYAGVAEFKRAVKLLGEGKAIQYIGASGPLQFDKNGDIAAPMAVWSIDPQGKVKVTGTVTVEQIDQLRTALK